MYGRARQPTWATRVPLPGCINTLVTAAIPAPSAARVAGTEVMAGTPGSSDTAQRGCTAARRSATPAALGD